MSGQTTSGEKILADYSSALLDLYRAAREMPATEFQDSAIKAMGRTLRFDSSIWGGGMVDETAFVINSFHLNNQSPEVIDSLSEIFPEDEVTAHVSANLGTVMNAHMASIYRDKRKSRMRALVSRFESQNGLIVAQLEKQSNLVQWIALYRKSVSDEFSASEQSILQAVYPHLFEALAVNRLAQFDATHHDRRHLRASVGVVDKLGVVNVSDSEFVRTLNREWPSYAGGRLPAHVVESLSSRLCYRGVSIAIDAQLIGQLYFVRARVLGPLDRLSTRERQIARLYSQGLSYKEIARSVSLSPNTVRTYLQTVYAKLEITDKAHLAALVAQLP